MGGKESIVHPDVLGLVADAGARFEVDNVQYTAILVPDGSKRGGRFLLDMHLQNVLDTPVVLTVTAKAGDGDLAGNSSLGSIGAFKKKMGPGECARLMLPVETRPRLSPGGHKIVVRVAAPLEAKGSKGVRIVGKKGGGADQQDISEVLGLSNIGSGSFRSTYMREVRLRSNVEDGETKSTGKRCAWEYQRLWDMEDTTNIPRASKYVDTYYRQLTGEKMAAEMLGIVERKVDRGMSFMAAPLLPAEKIWLSRWLLASSGSFFKQGRNARGLLLLGVLGCFRDGEQPKGSKIAANMAHDGFSILLSEGVRTAVRRQNKHYGKTLWSTGQSDRLISSLGIGGDLRDHLTVIWKLYIRSALLFYADSPYEELDLTSSVQQLQNDFQKRRRGGSFFGDQEVEKAMEEMLVSSFNIEVIE
ncbi:MAG: hypothetical protein KAT70_09895, partial [Thermoplasmata archaeon]|nr:hypothetical protein [Thermoplasmata archaeon]